MNLEQIIFREIFIKGLFFIYFMNVIYNFGDYEIFLDGKELEKIVIRDRTLSPFRNRYPWFEADVVDSDGKLTGEWLAVTCSNDSSVAFSPGGILFRRQEENIRDINVFVFTPHMMKPKELSRYRRENKPSFMNIYSDGFLMTRYDEHSDKIWIRPEILLPLKNARKLF